MAKKELAGTECGRLVVGTEAADGKFLCKCKCGNEVIVSRRSILEKTTKSCGCLQKETSRQNAKKAHKANRKHGFCGMPEHNIWHGIKWRCTSEKCKKKAYLQVKMCKRWRDSFEEFYNDLGPRPSLEMSVDRIETSGHYSCGKCDECRRNGWQFNCRWASRVQQMRNKTTNRIICFRGKEMPVSEVAEFCGISYKALWRRLKTGWSVEQATSIPVGSIATRRPSLE